VSNMISRVQLGFLKSVEDVIGSSYVLTGTDTAAWACDWTGDWRVPARLRSWRVFFVLQVRRANPSFPQVAEPV
jgi:hypothetical protein